MKNAPTAVDARAEREAGPRARGDVYEHVTFMGDGVRRRVWTPATRKERASRSAPAALDGATEAFFGELCRSAGLDAGRYRASIFARRRAACLRAVRAGDLGEARRSIEADPRAQRRALGAVMIGVTAFYRDPAVFDALGALLPDLAAGTGPLRALCVGCSDGAEVYSLAMLLASHGLLGGAEVCGVDCREDAIEAAREGVYVEEALRGVSASLLSRWTVRVGAPAGGGGRRGVQFAPELRGACRWVVADAFRLKDTPAVASQVGIVLCRNLAIYLTHAAAEELWGDLSDRLLPGGVLVVGRAERPVGRAAGELTRVSACVYRKTAREC